MTGLPESEVRRIQTELATNFDVPAQRIINAAFARAGVNRFDRAGNDLWEMAVCKQNGWEYEKPSAHLTSRWSRY